MTSLFRKIWKMYILVSSSPETIDGTDGFDISGQIAWEQTIYYFKNENKHIQIYFLFHTQPFESIQHRWNWSIAVGSSNTPHSSILKFLQPFDIPIITAEEYRCTELEVWSDNRSIH